MTIDMAAADVEVVRSGGGGDSLTYSGEGVENLDVRAGAGDDVIEGGAGNDHLRGDAGDDIIVGAAGRDTLVGGDGADISARRGRE